MHRCDLAKSNWLPRMIFLSLKSVGWFGPNVEEVLDAHKSYLQPSHNPSVDTFGSACAENGGPASPSLGFFLVLLLRRGQGSVGCTFVSDMRKCHRKDLCSWAWGGRSTMRLLRVGGLGCLFGPLRRGCGHEQRTADSGSCSAAHSGRVGSSDGQNTDRGKRGQEPTGKQPVPSSCRDTGLKRLN